MSAIDDPSTDIEQAVARLSGHGIVAGFGIPGRAVANLFVARGFPFCVVELNPATVDRCAAAGLTILQGDASEEAMLRRAGVERAAVLALAMPNEDAVLSGIVRARRLNPSLKILARCRHVSTALEATRLGADEVLSEEQVIAEGFGQLAGRLLVGQEVGPALRQADPAAREAEAAPGTS